MELRLPPFKTCNVVVDDMTLVDKKATAVLTVNQTDWWGLRKRELAVNLRCDKVTRKEPKWSSVIRLNNGHEIAPECTHAPTLDVATKTLQDMRNLHLVHFDQLLAYRLAIHIRKHHGNSSVSA